MKNPTFTEIKTAKIVKFKAFSEKEVLKEFQIKANDCSKYANEISIQYRSIKILLSSLKIIINASIAREIFIVSMKFSLLSQTSRQSNYLQRSFHLLLFLLLNN
jgi:hypothetical protein